MKINYNYNNVEARKLKESVFLSYFSKECLSKVVVNVLPGQRMISGGTSEPTCWMNLWSIGVFDAERNPGYATKLYPFITESLGIASDKIVLLFHDIAATQRAQPPA
ncbi:hypothetical protein TNIN_229161 [Trichonephila inaurata madagascariensis]|uniref:D-dopachrome decarboxylase n=1 Tax=Trichonephila inaurata madagascariensis TaxID=2747483 RepID=A0A8X7BYQ7_9ARAC|nr:hypothetical protein TNIN_229161 [Trichonephila inaurata madagascariensis]